MPTVSRESAVHVYHEGIRQALLAKSRTDCEANRERVLAARQANRAKVAADLWALRYKERVAEKRHVRAPFPAGVRAAVLSVGYCQYCGYGPKDGVKLHVDHIKPVSKGGTNDRSNLQALCELCNLGKSDSYDPASTQTTPPPSLTLLQSSTRQVAHHFVDATKMVSDVWLLYV